MPQLYVRSRWKECLKKNMGLIFSTFGTVYVARISIGANPQQAIKAIQEAEAYDGPSLIIAYAHCINHGINMAMGLEQGSRRRPSSAVTGRCSGTIRRLRLRAKTR